MKMKPMLFAGIIFSLIQCFAQNQADFNAASGDSSKGGLIDLKKLSVNHSISYGMSSFGGGSPLQSQGLYTTMLSYRFSLPVTLNLNFGFPLMSTYSSAQNLNAQNIQSLAYFKNMPIDMSLTWQPKPNLFVNLSVVRNTGYGYGLMNDPFMPSYFSDMNRSAATGAVQEKAK